MKIPAVLRAAGLGAALLLTLTATLVWAAPAGLLSPARTGFDPLSAAEQDWARQTATQAPGLAAQLASGQRVEILRVERHQEAKAVTRQGRWPRRADLYAYNYDTDTLIHTVVNLDTQAVDSIDTVQNVQLPLTQAETAQAIALALADARFQPLLAAQIQQITGQPLTNPAAQLKVHAMIFRADARPDQSLGAAAGCGLRRCAQLMLATHTDVLINLLPIVDLSRSELVSLNSFLESGP